MIIEVNKTLWDNFEQIDDIKFITKQTTLNADQNMKQKYNKQLHVMCFIYLFIYILYCVCYFTLATMSHKQLYFVRV